MPEAENYLRELQRAAPDFVQVDLNRFRQYREWDGHGYDTCWWSGLQVAVTPNGHVWTCVNKREHAGALIGDLTHSTFWDIWKNHRLARVTADCRVMCRGHLPNQAMSEMFRERVHPEFV